jgi:hypothetical protein
MQHVQKRHEKNRKADDLPLKYYCNKTKRDLNISDETLTSRIIREREGGDNSKD